MWWKKPSIIFIIFFTAAMVSLKVYFPQSNFLSYDTFGYYMHLPAKYIYHDEALKTDWYKQVNEKYKSTPTYFQIDQSPKGGIIMRFYKGLSYLWTPAFFAGHIYAKNFGYPADGFSMPYARSIIIFGAIFTIIGLFFARRILLHYFNETITTIALALMYFGTNFFFFSTIGNEVPHVYLFTLFLALIWFTIKWHEKPGYSNAIAIGLTLGLILAVRPSDVFIAIIPAMWGVYNKETLLKKIILMWRQFPQLLFAVMIAGLCIIPQLLYYHKYAGEYLVNIYEDPGATFDFLKPRFANILFGFRKGWFIYSPLSVLGFIGLVISYKKNKEYFLPAAIYLFCTIYLIASFSSLISYGWRGFVQSYAVLLIPTGYFVQYMYEKRIILRLAAAFVILPFIVLNIHQAYQVRIGTIHGSRMTRDYYFAVLGKNKPSAEDMKLLMVERSLTDVDVMPDENQYNKRDLLNLTFEDEISPDSLSPAPFEGKGIFRLGNGIEYSPDMKLAYERITGEDYCYLKATVNVYSDFDITDSLFVIITTMNNKKEHIKYRGSKPDDVKFIPGQWNLFTLTYQTPEIKEGDEIVQALVWYRGKRPVWIDNFKVTAYTLD